MIKSFFFSNLHFVGEGNLMFGNMSIVYSHGIVVLLAVLICVTVFCIAERSVGSEVIAPLRKPDGYSSLKNKESLIGFISEDFQPQGAYWVNEMHPLNQTTLDQFLREVGQRSLNYTIYTLQVDELVLGESYRNGDAPLANELAGRAILIRASDAETKAWFAKFQAARFTSGIIANVVLTGVGVISFGFGAYRDNWQFAALGIAAIFGSAWQGFHNSSPFPEEQITQIASEASARKREIEAWDTLDMHLNLNGKDENSDISLWQLMGSKDTHHQYYRRGNNDGHGHQQLVLFQKPSISAKFKRYDGRADVYGLKYTYYEPNDDSSLQQAYAGSGYNADGIGEFVLGTLTTHGAVMGCVYFDLPLNTLRIAGKIELLTTQNPDTGPSYNDCVNNYPCEASSTYCRAHEEL